MTTTLSTSAGTVAYASRGSGDPVVLLPSAGHDQHDYDEIRELLPGWFRSIGVDWPSHGRSPAGQAPSTELRLAQIIEELRLPARVFCALMSRPWFARLIYPLFSRAYMRPRTAAETARDLIPGSGLAVTDSGHLPHTTSPAAVAAELTSLASTAFDRSSRGTDARPTPPASKEQPS
jgi:pimeloyl-ACP methyl ester carboxylesterase